MFQEERVETLKLLASEIAVLIENAKLYDYLESKDYKLQLLEEQEKNIRLQLDEKERWAAVIRGDDAQYPKIAA
ncbi:hypothetical protein ABFY68_30360 [Paenibacillus validus]